MGVLEAGCFEELFFADILNFNDGSFDTVFGCSGEICLLDLAVVLLNGALHRADRTWVDHKMFSHPYQIARVLGSLYQMSTNRVTWNVVALTRTVAEHNLGFDDDLAP